MKCKTVIIIALLFFGLLFMMGARGRYAPTTWKVVTGGIEYSAGNVNVSAGTLTASGALTVGSIDGETITDNTIDDDSIDLVDITLDDFSWSAADVEPSLKTVTKTIDLDDDASTDDFQFDDDAGNSTAQNVDMGAILPAYAEIVSVQIRCFETVGAGTFVVRLGTASAGTELLGDATLDAANEIDGTATGNGPKLEAANAVKNVWIQGDPSGNWSAAGDAGRWAVMVTYIDYGAVYTLKNP